MFKLKIKHINIAAKGKIKNLGKLTSVLNFNAIF